MSLALEAEAIPLTPTQTFYRSIFDRADADGDGYITVHELHTIVSIHADDIPAPVVQRIHQMSDTNQDGRLDYGEFVAMINDPRLSNVFGQYVKKYVKFVVPRKALGAAAFDDIDNQYEDQYTCCPPKLGMVVVSVVEMVLFLVDEFLEEDSTKLATGPAAQLFIYDPRKRWQAWRFLTYMFVHIGHLHLTVNLVVQIFVGVPLEMVHGSWRILVIYVAGVIAGSLGTSITDPYSRLAGASGGVYSLITAHIASIIMNWKEMTFPGVQLAIFLLITVTDVGTSIYNRYFVNVNEHIGYAAHFAGAVAGLLVGINVLRNLRETKKERVIWWLSLITYCSLMGAAIFWNIFYEDYFPKSNWD